MLNPPQDARGKIMTTAVLGIIGGSGIYDLPGLENDARGGDPRARGASHLRASSPASATIAGLPIVFLPRHDQGHRLSPSDINYRANIDVLKRDGVTDLDFAVGLRLFQGGAAARNLCAGGSVRGSHLQAREFILRQRVRRPCVDGPSGVSAAADPSRRGCRGRGHRGRRAAALSRLHSRACNFFQLRREHDLQGPRL